MQCHSRSQTQQERATHILTVTPVSIWSWASHMAKVRGDYVSSIQLKSRYFVFLQHSSVQ